MDILKIFTKKNIEIVDLLAKNSLYLREIAEKLGCSAGQAYKTVSLLRKFDFVREKKIKNRKIISLNRENPLLARIRSLINVNNLINCKSYRNLKKTGKICIYGSFANGTDVPESDVDLAVYTDKSLLDVRTAASKLEKELGRKVSVLMLNKRKLEQLQKKDPEFYIRLKLTSICFNGDIFET